MRNQTVQRQGIALVMTQHGSVVGTPAYTNCGACEGLATCLTEILPTNTPSGPEVGAPLDGDDPVVGADPFGGACPPDGSDPVDGPVPAR